MWSVIGQARAVALLQRGLEKGSLAHAYLLVGPAQVGKMTLALDLARALNCEAAEPPFGEAQGRPCGECLSCQKITSAKHADVQIIGLSHNGDSEEAKLKTEISIDQIRQVQHSASLPPFEGKYKVFIIDGAELLSIEAANCLLKTLEEPIGKAVFILLTTNERLLPTTVVSRCQRVELHPVPFAEIETALNRNRGVEPEKARLLAKLSRGCPGWAISASLDDSLLQQRAERLDRLLTLISADAEERFTYAAQLAAQFGQNRGLVQEELNLWLDWWRDLLLVKAGLIDNITNIDRLDSLSDLAGGYTLAQIRASIDSLLMAWEQLKQNANPRLVLEVLMLDMPEAEERHDKVTTAQFEVKYD
ncbi:MAG: DNA polymerase III subunit delta' [Dehalococcoidales bacterium]|nr:DNA polymerase III subunit delta' [Dehalococcoidales bacterium]